MRQGIIFELVMCEWRKQHAQGIIPWCNVLNRDVTVVWFTEKIIINRQQLYIFDRTKVMDNAITFEIKKLSTKKEMKKK